MIVTFKLSRRQKESNMTDPIATDYDAIAAELGLPKDWRALGYDTPQDMDRLYRYHRDGRITAMRCPWSGCGFKRQSDVEAMFRHAHGAHGRRH